MDGKIFNSRGIHVAMVIGPAIFDLMGKKLYDLKGVNIYKLSGELVAHLPDAQNTKRLLSKSTDKLFDLTEPSRFIANLICDSLAWTESMPRVNRRGVPKPIGTLSY